MTLGNAVDIDVKRVSKGYVTNGQRLQVVTELDLKVDRGATLVVVGPSGCGKSTLLRLLSGAEAPDSGTVTPAPERAQHSATIEQTAALLPWRTALQNAHIGTELRIARGSRATPRQTFDHDALRRKILDDFRLFQLSGFEDYYPSKLSGGMQQRVAIIRALQSEPRLLFCDEPFAAIDFVTRLALNTAFKKIRLEMGCTTVFVTHNIEEAMFLADRLLVLNGRPFKVVMDFRPRLSRFSEDAVKCRQSPEFQGYFDAIWEKLKPGAS